MFWLQYIKSKLLIYLYIINFLFINYLFDLYICTFFFSPTTLRSGLRANLRLHLRTNHFGTNKKRGDSVKRTKEETNARGARKRRRRTIRRFATLKFHDYAEAISADRGGGWLLVSPLERSAEAIENQRPGKWVPSLPEHAPPTEERNSTTEEGSRGWRNFATWWHLPSLASPNLIIGRWRRLLLAFYDPKYRCEHEIRKKKRVCSNSSENEVFDKFIKTWISSSQWESTPGFEKELCSLRLLITND